MVVKELLEARWKIIAGMLVATGGAVVLSATYHLIQNLLTSPAVKKAPGSLQSQIQQLLSGYDFYVWSQWYAKSGTQILAVLAAVLGAGLIASETNKGTIFFLLSKPVSRTRVLLVKYAVSAAILLVVLLLSSMALLITAAVMGYPQSVAGALVSTLLLWLGMLFVLGLATLFSVLFKDVLRPLVITLVITILLSLPGLIPNWGDWNLTGYWANYSAYLGNTFPLKGLVILLVAAALPVAIAIPLFRKQQY